MSQFYSRENQGSGRFSNVPKVTKPLRGSSRALTLVCLAAPSHLVVMCIFPFLAPSFPTRPFRISTFPESTFRAQLVSYLLRKSFRNISAHCGILVAIICVTLIYLDEDLFLPVPCPIYVLCPQSTHASALWQVPQAACTTQIHLTLPSISL